MIPFIINQGSLSNPKGYITKRFLKNMIDDYGMNEWSVDKKVEFVKSLEQDEDKKCLALVVLKMLMDNCKSDV